MIYKQCLLLAVVYLLIGCQQMAVDKPAISVTTNIPDGLKHLLIPQPETGICPDRSLTLQVLGSGGPIADDDRASSAYLLWYQDQAIALIDIGGGSFQRFGAAGASLEHLALIGISHYHTDHSADLPALMKGAHFSQRTSPLPILGPGNTKHDLADINASPRSSKAFPPLQGYLESLFGTEYGAYRYLNGLLSGEGGLFSLQQHELDASEGQTSEVLLANPHLSVNAIGVHHGIVPTIAYRLNIANRSVVFSGDQSRFNPHMHTFSKDADVLIAHMAIPQAASGVARRLHRQPEDWAELASDANIKTLLLSHWMQRSLATVATDIPAMQQKYTGDIRIAQDFSCIVL